MVDAVLDNGGILGAREHVGLEEDIITPHGNLVWGGVV